MKIVSLNMKTMVIDILNEKAVALLKDLEALKLIKLRIENSKSQSNQSKWSNYKGLMTKQPLQEVDKQLSNLRDAWE